MSNLLARITIDPSVFHGKPAIRGLPYSVEMLLELLDSGMAREQILNDHPGLEHKDLFAAQTWRRKENLDRDYYDTAKHRERIAKGLKQLDLSHLVGREITGIEFPCQVQINFQFGGEDILYCMGKLVHEWNGMDRVILDWRLVDIQVLARIWDCKIEAWGKTENHFYLDFEGWGRFKCIPLPMHSESFGISPINLWF